MSSRQRRCWSEARSETATPILASCSAGVSPSCESVRDARADLPDEAGDAHHEELVEVVGRDRQEAQLLEQRMVAVLGLLEDAAVELEPGQLAVDEALRRLPQRRALARAGFATGSGGLLMAGSSTVSTSASRAAAPRTTSVLLFAARSVPAFYDSFATDG